jgi:hypothetical protein
MTAATRDDVVRTPRYYLPLFEILLVLAMVFATVAVIGTIIDRPGLGLYGDTDPTVDAELADPVDFGDRLTTRIDDGGIVVDADSGLAPVDLGAPVTARFTFTDPTTDQRVIWVLWQVAGPLLAIAGIWLALLILRTAKGGDPFVAANVRRLWILSNLIAIGGTAYSMFSGFAGTLMIQRSAAMDLAPVQFSVSFLPIIAGIGVAVLARVWQVGVDLRDDLEGVV